MRWSVRWMTTAPRARERLAAAPDAFSETRGGRLSKTEKQKMLAGETFIAPAIRSWRPIRPANKTWMVRYKRPRWPLPVFRATTRCCPSVWLTSALMS